MSTVTSKHTPSPMPAVRPASTTTKRAREANVDGDCERVSKRARTDTISAFDPALWQSEADCDAAELAAAPFCVTRDEEHPGRICYHDPDCGLSALLEVPTITWRGRIDTARFCYRGHVYALDRAREVVVRRQIPGYTAALRIQAATKRLNEYWEYDTKKKAADLLWALNDRVQSAVRFKSHWRQLADIFQAPLVGIMASVKKLGRKKQEDKDKGTVCDSAWIRKRCRRRPSVKLGRWPEGHQHVAGEAADEIEQALAELKEAQQGFWPTVAPSDEEVAAAREAAQDAVYRRLLKALRKTHALVIELDEDDDGDDESDGQTKDWTEIPLDDRTAPTILHAVGPRPGKRRGTCEYDATVCSLYLKRLGRGRLAYYHL